VSLVGCARSHIAAGEPAATAARGMGVKILELKGICVRNESMVVKSKNFPGTLAIVDSYSFVEFCWIL
jgi:hypothetical protein